MWFPGWDHTVFGGTCVVTLCFTLCLRVWEGPSSYLGHPFMGLFRPRSRCIVRNQTWGPGVFGCLQVMVNSVVLSCILMCGVRGGI